MFCPNCGKGEQTPESYCRSCGAFLADFSGKSYLLNKLLGGQTPETQVTVNLIINLVTALISIFLLGFLNGYFDAEYARTQKSAPPIIYLVYIFLGLVAVWQVFSFFIGMRLRRKVMGRRIADASVDAGGVAGTRQKSLPEAKLEDVPSSITEEATRMLDRVPRK
ncbi:MAG: hypothetical protein AABN95_07710 [Acidobacteriota bacterium]